MQDVSPYYIYNEFTELLYVACSMESVYEFMEDRRKTVGFKSITSTGIEVYRLDELEFIITRSLILKQLENNITQL